MGKKVIKDTFGYLGEVFQEKLVAEIMTDHKFADSIMELIDFNFFEGEGLRYIVSKIHEAWHENEVNLTYDSLEARVRAGTSDDLTLNFRLKQLDVIKEASLNDSEYTQKTALNFCKQQSLKITLKSIQNIVDKGQPDDYPKCEDLLKKALELGNGKDDIVDRKSVV